MTARRKAKIQFNQQNSRISFGRLIFEAAKQGNWEGLELTLQQEEASEHIEHCDEHGMTPLIVAAKNGHLKCIKVLLAHKCDLYSTVKRDSQELYSWDIAAENNNESVAQYLKGCVDDLAKFKFHRAMMEADIFEICQSSRVTSRDLEEFDNHMEKLTRHCGFELGGDENSQSLLILASKANNGKIVKHLFEKYDVTPFENDQETGETALHIACQRISPLRFYITKRCKELLFTFDLKGNLPLHVACEMNDVAFISWLFQNILEELEDRQTPVDTMFLSNPVKSLPRSISQPNARKMPYKYTFQPSPSDAILFKKEVGTSSQSSLPSVEGSEVHLSPPVFSILEENCTPEPVDPLEQLNGYLLEESLTSSSVSLKEQAGTYFDDHLHTESHGLPPIETSVMTDSSGDKDPSSLTDGREPSLSNDTESSPSSTTVGSSVLGSSAPYSPSLECSFQYPEENSQLLESSLSTLQETLKQHGDSPLTFENILSVHMRLFAVAANGRSVLHIAAKKGFSKLLDVILKVAKYLEHNPDGADIRVLIRRDSTATPIDEAITSKRPKCLELLLDFASHTYIYDDIISDPSLITKAVTADSSPVISVLLEHGVFAGLRAAILMAVQMNRKELLQVLMFYHTQIMTIKHCTRVKRSGSIVVDKGCLCWNELNLCHIDPSWLHHSRSAIASVSHTLRTVDVSQPVLKCHNLYCHLGLETSNYFHADVSQPLVQAWSHLFLLITEINLSNNRLEAVPPELFQFPSLEILRLSNNKLQALPSSFNTQQPFYTCGNLRKLELEGNKLKTLPEDLFFGIGKSLEELNARDNYISDLPPGLWICPQLTSVLLGQNHLHRLHYFSDVQYFYDPKFSHKFIQSIQIKDGRVPVKPKHVSDETFTEFMNYVTRLNVFYNTVQQLASECLMAAPQLSESSLVQHVFDIHWLRSKLSSEKSLSKDYTDIVLPPGESCSLTYLDLSKNNFHSFPWDLTCVAPNLDKLDLRGNFISAMDIVRDIPSNLSSLILGDNKLKSVSSIRPPLPCGSPVKLHSGYLHDPKSVGYCKHCSCKGYHDKMSHVVLSNNQLTAFKCVDIISCPGVSGDHSSFDKVILQPFFPTLSVLALDNNSLEAFPEGIHHLGQLSSLSLSHNPITKIPKQLGLMNPQILLILKLEGVFPKNLPPNLLNKPAKQVLAYFKSLQQKAIPYYRMKLMFIGNCNKGKTTLLQCLTRRGKVTRFKEVELGLNKQPLSTVGVDLGDWEFTGAGRGRPKVTFMTWDFGGQEEYYATHQCFLTQRSLYVLVWNVNDGEEGLLSLRPWLENIGGRVPGAPVMVVATHTDQLLPQKKSEIIKTLSSKFKKMYFSGGLSKTHQLAYPQIYPKCFFLSRNDSAQIGILREEIYEYALSIKPPVATLRSTRGKSYMEPLLKQVVPESYIKLQDYVRDLARKCIKEKRPPILNMVEFRNAASEGGFLGKSYELEQAISFLHDNGILLHYDDPALSDLFFVDPQWLCSVLACVVTVQEKNPFQKNGFMLVAALDQVIRDDQLPRSLRKEFISLMQKFEIVLPLDNERLLIPSLLPSNQEASTVVHPKLMGSPEEVAPHDYAIIERLDLVVFARFFLVPYIPNGFFPRLIARVMGSSIFECVKQSVRSSAPEDVSILNNLHWRCWRSGIVLIWQHLEIFRIAPGSPWTSHTDATYVVSASEMREVRRSEQGIEIKIAVLPEEHVKMCDFLSSNDSQPCSSLLSVWLLQQSSELIDSVFEDWYEGFARKKAFDPRAVVHQVNPCQECLKQRMVRFSSSHGSRKHTEDVNSIANQSCDYSDMQKHLYLFTSAHCVLAASKRLFLQCPDHGDIPVSLVAPDLAFHDFPADKLFYNPESVVKKQALGSGGYGSVFMGTVDIKNQAVNVAIKQFSAIFGPVEGDSYVKEETTAWNIYLNGSREARMMHRMKHEHVLGLVGLVFQPLRLLLELAPMGDLKSAIKPFREKNVKLNRRTLKAVMLQVASALSYIHSLNIVYRDLKPGNILVWEFPEPRTQWNPDVSVLIKLADYGISKHCSAEGARGSEGTPAYLPPDVLLHGGTAAFTTKLDVYSFGMFLYYLLTFMGPFEMDKGRRPITALLDEGKRPELGAANRPAAIQMQELMCWCWSDRPQHRPTFHEIHNVVNSAAFLHLLGISRLTSDGDQFKTACMYLYKQQGVRNRISAEDCMIQKRASASPSPAVVNLFSAASADEENTLQVWYGTEGGKIGTVQFSCGESNCETITNLSTPINRVCTAAGRLWVGTKKKGLQVYAIFPFQHIASWGTEEALEVYHLLYVKQSGLMFTLTNRGLFLLETQFPKTDMIHMLVPKSQYPSNEVLLSTGIVVSSRVKLEESQVWCCPEKGGKFKIFSGSDPKMHGVREVPIPVPDLEHESHIEHLQSYDVDSNPKLVFSDRLFLQSWDVLTKEKIGDDLNCHLACASIYEPEAEHKGFVTSLQSLKDILYVGTAGGVILVLSLDSFTTVRLLHAYDGPVRCLLASNQAHYVRHLSRMHSHRDSFPPSSPMYAETSSLTSSIVQMNPDGNIVLSLGTGYRGVVGDSVNHPTTFNMPSDSVGSCLNCRGSLKTTCCCDSSQSRWAKPNPSFGCMLYWSSSEQGLIAEDNNYRRSSIGSVSTINTIPELSESAST